MAFLLKTVSILAILARVFAVAAAKNVTEAYDSSSEEVAATLMSESDYRINNTLNPDCQDGSTQIHYNCGQNVTTNTVVAIKVVPAADEGVQDNWVWAMLHMQNPALMVSMTDRDNADVKVVWKKIRDCKTANCERAFNYPGGTPNFTSAIMITKLIEFDDPKNRGTYDGKSEVKKYPMSDFSWTREIRHEDESTLDISFMGSHLNTSESKSVTGGTINITLFAYAKRGFGTALPHLSHSHKTNQIDIQLINITTSSTFRHARFGLEMVMVTDVLNASVDRHTRRTNNDEHTPGIFEYDELVLVNPDDSSLQSYMQWKPVVYSTSERKVTAATEATLTLTNVEEELNGTTLDLFYGRRVDTMLVTQFNVTFGRPGKPGDTSDLYSRTGYHAWTFTFGTGVPIEPGWSDELMMALGITLAVVALACAGGAAACCYRKYKRSRSLDITDTNPYSGLGGAGS